MVDERKKEKPTGGKDKEKGRVSSKIALKEEKEGGSQCRKGVLVRSEKVQNVREKGKEKESGT